MVYYEMNLTRLVSVGGPANLDMSGPRETLALVPTVPELQRNNWG